MENPTKLRRRLMILRLGALVPAMAAVVPEAQAQRTGITDNDPSDGPGNGRGSRRGTGIPTGSLAGLSGMTIEVRNSSGVAILIGDFPTVP